MKINYHKYKIYKIILKINCHTNFIINMNIKLNIEFKNN